MSASLLGAGSLNRCLFSCCSTPKKLETLKIMILSNKKNNLHLLVSTVFLLSHSFAYAEHSVDSDSTKQEASITNLRAAAQNPLTPMYSLPLKYVYHGDANRGGVSVGSIQPIFPVALGKDWNLINQLSLNFIDTPGGVTGIENLPNPYVKYAAIGAKGAAGLADLNFTSLISPVRHDNLIWGAGVTITMPSDAPSRELGSGKFSFGPAATWVFQNQSWTLGLQASQLWSAFGSDGRKDVSQMLLKPIINYNLPEGWYLVSNMTIIANWNTSVDQQWTVPIGGGFGKLFAIGDYKINSRLEGYYNVDRPDQAPDWSMATTVQLLFPE